jgi:hypothetical protein
MAQVRNNLAGQTFGKLTVTSFADKDKNGNSRWNCLCSCGEVKVIWASALTRGLTQSCGCHRKEATRTRRTTHGKSGAKDATYSVWASMLKRCNNPNSASFSRYGGRGIRVCERWADFAAFLSDMGPKPVGYSIERVDNDLGYAPDNCVWVPRAAQARNKSNNRKITVGPRTMLLVDWAAETGISGATIANRIDKLGWGPEKAVTTPVRATKSRLVSET